MSFSQYFNLFFWKWILHLPLCATTGFLPDLDNDTSCILYFFGLGKNTKNSLWSHLSALFWLSKHEKIVEALVVSISLKWPRNDIYPVYVYPFSGWDRLFTKKEYPSLSRLGGFLRHSFLPFRIWGTIYEKGPLDFTFQLSFQTLLTWKDAEFFLCQTR